MKKKKNSVYVNQKPNLEVSVIRSRKRCWKMMENSREKNNVGIINARNLLAMNDIVSFHFKKRPGLYMRKPLMKKNSGIKKDEKMLLKLKPEWAGFWKEHINTWLNTTRTIVKPRMASRYSIRCFISKFVF